MRDETAGTATDGRAASPPWPGQADGVFRGGGVKGVALAGAIEAMAHHPQKPVRRWNNVAGASAGAIIAAYLAIGRTPDELLAAVRDVPYARLQDYPRGSRILGVLNLLWGGHGLARGDAFERWFDDELGGATFATLHREGFPGRYRLQLIACDVANRRLLVLPDDLADYARGTATSRLEPDAVRVSRAARMSMSIPFFYEPITDLTYVNPKTGARTPATIVDGGTLSNFPVWLFDVDPTRVGRMPRWPTFGITLCGGRGVGGGIKDFLLHHAGWPVGMAAQIFDTAQSAWDDRFVSHSTVVRTFEVDADGVGTTDFGLRPDRPPLSTIVENGKRAGREFLDAFDLRSYRNTFAATVAPPQPAAADAPLART